MKRCTIPALAGLMLAVPAWLSAAECESVVYRLWSPEEVRYYEAGETVELAPGETWDLYVHHRSQSETPYTTKSRISYAETLGLRGPSAGSVVNVLGMKKQSDDDVGRGRIELTGREPGETALAYQMLWVAKSGLFESMPEDCKSGLIPIAVTRGGSAEPEEDEGDAGGVADLETYRAADRLLARVYTGLLRRPAAGEMSEEHLRLVVEKGHRGAVLAGMELAAGDEFQKLDPALAQQRDPRYGRRQNDGRDPRYDATGHLNLLSAMYTDLYGTTQIPMQEHQRNVKELWNCFNETDGREGCERFARELLKSEQFAEHQKELIDKLPESYHRDRK